MCKKIIIISILFIVVVSITILLDFKTKFDFKEYANATTTVMENHPDDEYIATVNDAKVYRSEFESYKSGYELTENQFTDEDILDKLVVQEVVIQEAKKLGFTATEEEIDAFVNETMDLVYGDEAALSIITEFNESAGISMDEYQIRCREIGEVVILSKKLKESIKDEWLLLKTDTNFETYYDDYVDSLCDAADIEYFY